MKWDRCEPDQRDILLDQVRRGEITPNQAEQEAKKLGLEPFETEPKPCDFDPDKMHWWSLPMAIAWIAWRNSASVREHCAEYREECRIFVVGSWNVPINGGTEFARIDGHELKTLGPSTVARLSLVETYLTSTKTLPPTTQMTVAEAEKELLAALAAGRITAIAKDAAGLPVEIPLREWPYLELFEEGQADVLKHNALDRMPAFSDIKLAADAIKQIWSIPSNVETSDEEFPVEPTMMEPMLRSGAAGYVPLSSAIYWIMTEAGNVSRYLNDTQSWEATVRRLTPLMSTGEVEVIGRNLSGQPQPLDRHLFAQIPIGHPLRESFSLLFRDGPWISCTPYLDEEHWGRDFNDIMYLVRATPPAFTHLQVKKSDILKHFPCDGSASISVVVDDSAGPSRPCSPALQLKIRHVVKELWPDGILPARVQDRDKAIAKWFKTNNQTVPSERTIRRALN